MVSREAKTSRLPTHTHGADIGFDVNDRYKLTHADDDIAAYAAQGIAQLEQMLADETKSEGTRTESLAIA